MSLLSKLSWDGLRPSRLWGELDGDVRALAARSVYRGESGGEASRAEADLAIATALRFRPAMVRKLPVEKRIRYLAGSVRPDDSMAANLLLSLHLEQRRELLSAFLDELGIPQQDGLISDDYDMSPPEAERLGAAVDALYERFPAEQVDLYLSSLVAMEPDTWQGLPALLASRA